MYTSADFTIEANAFLARMRGAEKFNPYREGTTAHDAYEMGWLRGA